MGDAPLSDLALAHRAAERRNPRHRRSQLAPLVVEAPAERGLTWCARRPGGPARNLQAHYNIAPTDPVGVVRPAAGAVELVSTRWGLVPWWWKKPLKELPASFNARAETVADKPMFHDAFARHRCVIPASGYYEWLKRPDGRQPYFMSAAADGGVLSFAGLWDRWKNPETGEPVISCNVSSR
jgi:putative SOS response-associated peptidase YedK